MIICTYKSRFNDGIFSTLRHSFPSMYAFYALVHSQGVHAQNKSSATMDRFYLHQYRHRRLLRSISNTTGTNSQFSCDSCPEVRFEAIGRVTIS